MRPSLSELGARRLENHALEGCFYYDPEIYAVDLERVWRCGWLFAAHSCEIPRPGDYLTVEVDVDSIIVLRGDDGQARAFHNVCRHRGTRLSTESSGQLGKIVCPYHQWVYERDGKLASCRGMHEIDRGELGLKSVALREVGGLIFISPAEEPLDFTRAQEVLDAALKPQGLGRAKVACSIDYEVGANWKVVWENNRECYHCDVSHPQYIKANFDRYNADDTSEAVQQRIEAQVRRSEQKWAACGLQVTHRQTGMATFPCPGDPEGWYAVNRTAMAEGYVSESMDGEQVAPLMGEYADPDVGTLRVRVVPGFWNHSSCDHAVSTRLLPAGAERTRVRVTWLVDERAREGEDYELEKLLPFWRLTSEQDWEICERVQLGVRSAGYIPGPLSSHKEYNVDAFIRWYLTQVNPG